MLQQVSLLDQLAGMIDIGAKALNVTRRPPLRMGLAMSAQTPKAQVATTKKATHLASNHAHSMAKQLFK